MKYLKRYNESRGETLIDKKIVYLNDITDDLRDSGYEVDIFNGSLIGRSIKYNSFGFREDLDNGHKYIYLVIKYPIGKETDKLDNPDDQVWNHDIVKKLISRLIKSKIGYRGHTGYIQSNGRQFSDKSIIKILIDKKMGILKRDDLEKLIS